MTHNVTLFKSRKGFTLVELMVVVVIIGILAGLITVAVNSARNMVNQGVAKIELSGIAMAVEAYKQKYGEYPPDFTDRDAIVRHVQKRWPRYTPVATTGDTCEKIISDIKTGSAKFLNGAQWNFSFNDKTTEDTRFNASVSPRVHACDKARMSALAFWLGGFPAVVGEQPTTLAGFHADSNDPFFAKTTATGADLADLPREAPLLEITESNFKHESIDGASGMPVGMAFFVRGQMVSYFRGTSATTEKAKEAAYLEIVETKGIRDTKWTRITFYGTDGEVDGGYAYPYATSARYNSDGTRDKITWANASSFQLILPGKDGRFNGNDAESTNALQREETIIKALKIEGGDATTSDKITPLDLDNIVNFGDTATIEGQLP